MPTAALGGSRRVDWISSTSMAQVKAKLRARMGGCAGEVVT